MIFLRVSSKVFRWPVGGGGGTRHKDAPLPPAPHTPLPTASVVKLKLLGRTKIVLGSVVSEGWLGIRVFKCQRFLY